jgi:DNA-binding XRE family transcriptional regulator
MRALREAAGLTQLDVADELGVSYRTIGHWETAARSPQCGLAVDWTKLLGRRLLVVREGHFVDDLLDALPRLTELREAAGLTQAAAGQALCITEHAVGHAERTAGTRTRLSTVQRLMGLYGAQVVLERAGAVAA